MSVPADPRWAHRAPRDDRPGKAFARIFNHGLATYKSTAGGVGRSKRDYVAQLIFAQLELIVPGRYSGFQAKQVQRLQDGELRTFTPDLVEAICRAVPTIDRAAAYAAVGLLPPEVDEVALRRLLKQAAKHTSDQGDRRNTRYSVQAGAGHAAVAV